MNNLNELKVIVAIPCFNEENTIADVVRDFCRVLPGANVCVYDNNSTDQSVINAINAGATVEKVRKQGKGNVMREIFDRAGADLIFVVDGDGTYCAEDAPVLIKTMHDRGCDMVVGNRLNAPAKQSFKTINLLGNYLIAATINWLFKTKYRDVLSGYRLFGKRFVDRVALLTPEFETEVELTLRALEEKLLIEEVPVSYRARKKNSRSKLKPFRDGVRIMLTIAMILRDIYPLRLYGLISIFCLLLALIAATLRFMNLFGIITLPNAVLTGLLFLLIPIGVFTFGMGLILSAVNTRFSEIKQIMLRKK